MRAFQSELLSKCRGLVHGFVYDPAGPNTEEIASSNKLQTVVMVRQVHGNTVFFADGHTDRKTVQADSIVSRKAGRAVAVVTADCVPVLVCFPNSGCVCAIHAGWRGTSRRVVKNCIDAACREYRLNPRDAVAAIGPAIGKCCYEVTEEVVSRFLCGYGRKDRWLFQKGGGKYLLDLCELNRMELVASGVLNVETLDVCTCCGNLPSYRREGPNAGRLISFVGFAS